MHSRRGSAAGDEEVCVQGETRFLSRDNTAREKSANLLTLGVQDQEDVCVCYVCVLCVSQ